MPCACPSQQYDEASHENEEEINSQLLLTYHMHQFF